MVARVKTFCFMGIEAIPVDVQVKISSGMPSFSIVGLGDKAVAESKERVRAALTSIGLSWPQQKVVVNLAPADLQKEGSHFDLAIAAGILVEMEVIDQEAIDDFFIFGELSLDGRISKVDGAIVAAIAANQNGCGIICSPESAKEASWSGNKSNIPAKNLISLINHLKGEQIIPRVEFEDDSINQIDTDLKNLSDIKGQGAAKRALEIAAAGGHNMLMVGPPGSGKSMLASRLNGILPKPDTSEILQINTIHSVSGNIKDGKLITCRPFRDPHHSCSMPAMVGGGIKAKPGEISLAHNGVLFLDELAEFPQSVLDSLRQPVESGSVTVSRANAHITYPANFQLIAAMNPCRCGYLGDPEKSCKKAPVCGEDYRKKISGPMLDRIDVVIDVPRVDIFADNEFKKSESSQEVALRVLKSRDIQLQRYKNYPCDQKTNAKVEFNIIEKYVVLDDVCTEILRNSSKKLGLSMRGLNRILRVARTIADLDGSQNIKKPHLLEAIGYRRIAW